MSSSSPNVDKNDTNDPLLQTWDIIILGSGAAALTTALEALTTTTSSPPPRVLLLEKSPQTWAGGNGYFTAGAYRVAHKGLPDILPLVSNVPAELAARVDLQAYSEEEFERDLGGHDTILLHAAINNYEFAPRRWADHGLVYADYYFILFGNKLLEMGLA
jgi:glycine/D-amino acid oxidase-like deaminating enzyme